MNGTAEATGVGHDAKAGGPPPASPPAGTPPLAGPRGLALFLATAAALAGIDLWTKALAFGRIAEGEVVTVVPGFWNFILAKNFGAAFSVGWGQRNLFLIVSTVAFGVLAWFSWTNKSGRWLHQAVLGMIASGVIGNVHDRLTLGYVRDFVDWYAGSPSAGIGRWCYERFGTNHWPTFNVADACICVGTGLLLVKLWRDEKAAERAGKDAAAQGKAGA